MERIRAATLYRYEMPPAPFRLIDEGAGYWVSDESVTPLGVTRIDPAFRRGRLEGLPAAIAATGATLVALESLWGFHDVVKASGLTFSMIRMRNAAER